MRLSATMNISERYYISDSQYLIGSIGLLIWWHFAESASMYPMLTIYWWRNLFLWYLQYFTNSVHFLSHMRERALPRCLSPRLYFGRRLNTSSSFLHAFWFCSTSAYARWLLSDLRFCRCYFIFHSHGTFPLYPFLWHEDWAIGRLLIVEITYGSLIDALPLAASPPRLYNTQARHFTRA